MSASDMPRRGTPGRRGAGLTGSTPVPSQAPTFELARVDATLDIPDAGCGIGDNLAGGETLEARGPGHPACPAAGTRVSPPATTLPAAGCVHPPTTRRMPDPSPAVQVYNLGRALLAAPPTTNWAWIAAETQPAGDWNVWDHSPNLEGSDG